MTSVLRKPTTGEIPCLIFFDSVSANSARNLSSLTEDEEKAAALNGAYHQPQQFVIFMWMYVEQENDGMI